MMKKVLLLTLVGVSFLFTSCVVQESPVTMWDELALENRLVELLATVTTNLRSDKRDALVQAEGAAMLAAELSPNDPRVLDALGCVAWRLGDLERAEEFFKKALQQNPDYDRAYDHLAFIALADGNEAAAEALLSEALRRNPLNHRARNNLAVYYFEKSDGNWDNFDKAYQELIKITPTKAGKEKIVRKNYSLFDARIQNAEDYEQ